ncbi:hypothetical protein EGR_03968 [Echinococcus granulosus]|uniref:Uncharacterized protein n=1 Tax=Echinococcus granulosus TaxID=6210 RepID=W6UI12_ECHGR|nr:hypothetical protein EGR_03968 [Echinococcus granulosus]EUB61120.1 hypothetical protein EGR_03968 [Echinococcus granulosus]
MPSEIIQGSTLVVVFKVSGLDAAVPKVRTKQQQQQQQQNSS